jgi:hypothetical protein
MIPSVIGLTLFFPAFHSQFICQTFHEFAQQSVQPSSWENQFYRRQRERGESDHSAIRALAYKWIRIISPAGRPTSLTVNLSMRRPLQKRILPFLRLDGSPQTLEGLCERSVDGGGGRLCRLRVTLDRAARRGLFPRGERPALGTRRRQRQDRKGLRKPGFRSGR